MVKVVEAINETLADINDNPHIFHNEIDIHAILYNKLRRKYPKIYSTGEICKVGSKYKTNRVHCEYYMPKEKILNGLKINNVRGGSLDLVIFSKEYIENINSTYLRFDNSDDGYRPIALEAAIEIKLENGASGKERWNLIEKDINKLLAVKEYNKKYYKNETKLYLIYVVRWPCKEINSKKNILDISDKAHKNCDELGILFFTNDKSNYFLEKDKKAGSIRSRITLSTSPFPVRAEPSA
jgi:hypothetical protein